MFQVLYEYEKPWPERGTMQLDVPRLIGEIHVSPESAKQRAKGYLTCEVGMAFRPGDPTLIWGERPVWRMSIYLHLRGYGPITLLGSIDIDAMTRAIIPLTTDQITAIQDRADELATHFTPSADPAG
jgi:hypothetical protein